MCLAKIFRSYLKIILDSNNLIYFEQPDICILSDPIYFEPPDLYKSGRTKYIGMLQCLKRLDMLFNSQSDLCRNATNLGIYFQILPLNKEERHYLESRGIYGN